MAAGRSSLPFLLFTFKIRVLKITCMRIVPKLLTLCIKSSRMKIVKVTKVTFDTQGGTKECVYMDIVE